MSGQARVKHVMKGTAQRGRCRYCRQRVVFAICAPYGKRLPFDREPIYAAEITNPDTGVRFEVWPTELLHVINCPRRKQATSSEARS